MFFAELCETKKLMMRFCDSPFRIQLLSSHM